MAETVPLAVPIKGHAEEVTASGMMGDGGFGASNNQKSPSANQNDPADNSGDLNAMRLAQLMTIGQGIAVYVQKANPLNGVHNGAEATAAARREARDLFNPVGFSKPKDRAEWMARVSANTAHFRLSYAGCYGLTLIYVVLTSPFMLFELALLAGLWALFFKVNKPDDVVTVGQYQLGRKEKMMVLFPLATFVVFFGGLISSMMYIVFLGTLFVGSHASFRIPVEVDPLDALNDAGVNVAPPDFV